MGATFPPKAERCFRASYRSKYVFFDVFSGIHEKNILPTLTLAFYGFWVSGGHFPQFLRYRLSLSLDYPRNIPLKSKDFSVKSHFWDNTQAKAVYYKHVFDVVPIHTV